MILNSDKSGLYFLGEFYPQHPEKYIPWNPADHHIWCNFAWEQPPETCNMCHTPDGKGLKDMYPMDGLTPDELQKKHFPNVVKVK